MQWFEIRPLSFLLPSRELLFFRVFNLQWRLENSRYLCKIRDQRQSITIRRQQVSTQNFLDATVLATILHTPQLINVLYNFAFVLKWMRFVHQMRFYGHYASYFNEPAQKPFARSGMALINAKHSQPLKASKCSPMKYGKNLKRHSGRHYS